MTTDLLFPLGQTVATPGAIEFLSSEELNNLLYRHGTGDWSEMDTEDQNENQDAVANGGSRVFSSYTIRNKRLFVITEWDRSVTTVLLASEY